MFLTQDENNQDSRATWTNRRRVVNSPRPMSNRQVRLSTKSHAPITDNEVKRLLNKWFNLNLEPHG